jgi:hypothetical protein
MDSRVKAILNKITYIDIVKEYQKGYFSTDTNKIFNDLGVTVEVIPYDCLHEINFYDENEELLYTADVLF